MPSKAATERAHRDAREGKSPSTQAGEFVREEIHHIREGKHGARSPKQAIAIGLSEARRAGVKVAPPSKGTASPRTRRAAKLATKRAAKGTRKRPSTTRSRAITKALKREGSAATTTRSLSRHEKAAASRRTASQRSASARKAARTKGPAERSAAARKAARTRARNRAHSRAHG
jgi:hypothetical protein